MRATILLTTLCVFGCDDNNNNNSMNTDMASVGDVDMQPDLGTITGCDIIKQDCPSGEKCATAGGMMMMAAGTQCVPNGTVAEGQPCTRTNGMDNCEAGLACSRGAGAVCRKICADDTTCGTGQKCAAGRGNATSGVCTPTCAPFGNDCTGGTNCSATGTSLGTMTPFFSCRTPGTADQFNDCNFGTACVADEVCDPTQMWCAPLCDKSGQHNCPANSGDGGIPLSCKSFGTSLANDPGYCGG